MEVKAMQTKQNQLSSFLYKIGSDMVLEQICTVDAVHRQLRARSLKRRDSGRKLEACDGIDSLCLYQDGCNVNVTCGEGACVDGTCLPATDEYECDAIMQEFTDAANNCSTLVVIDGIEEGFTCLHKYVDDLYGDCVHTTDPDMDECTHISVIGTEIIHAFEHSIELLKTHPDILVEKMMMAMGTDPAAFSKMQERILELSLPVWLDSEEDPESLLDGSDLHTVMDMCDPLLSFGRSTDLTWDQECTLFEGIMCMAMDSSNATFLSTEDGVTSMNFCARALRSLYPADEVIFQTCLAASAANAGGPAACIEEELDPLVVQYIVEGPETCETATVITPAGTDQSHNVCDAMLAKTMDSAAIIDANTETATYMYLRRLEEKKRRLQGTEECLNINGKEYCTKGRSTQSIASPKVPASNGKITKAHKFFTRKHKARKLHRAHKNLMRKHRQLSR